MLQLRTLIRPRAAVVLSFHVVEISPVKIKSAGFSDAEKLFGIAANKSPIFQLAQGPSEVAATINEMRKRGLIKVLGEPKMCTMVGETVSFHSGGEIPVQRLAKDGTVVEDKVELVRESKHNQR